MKTKKVTKLLALVLSAVMLISVVPMIASAEVGLAIGTIGMSDPVDGVLTFTVPYTATDVDQVTVLAVIGSEAEVIAPALAPVPTAGNIAYIDQQASSGTTSFTFKVETSKFTAEKNNIYIKIGGTAINEAKQGTTQTYETTSTYTVTGAFIANGNTGDATVKLFNSTDDIATATPIGTVTSSAGAYEFLSVLPGSYKITIAVPKATKSSVSVAVVDSNVTAPAPTKQPMVGDLTGNSIIDIDDFGILTAVYGQSNALIDLSGDGIVDIDDFGLLTASYGQSGN